MNRRSFLSTLAAGLAAAADPERLLWTPSKRTISIPSSLSAYAYLDKGHTFYMLSGEGIYVINPINWHEMGVRILS